jgi:hypothetical protein
MSLGEMTEDPRGVIRRAIIDENDLEVAEVEAPQALETIEDLLIAVVHTHDDAGTRAGHGGRSSGA